MPVVLSDTSPLIFLTKIGHLNLLPELFEQVWVTPEVATECRLPLPAWAILHPAPPLPATLDLPPRFHLGERSALALALTQPDCLLITDDEPAKQVAYRVGVRAIGTLGVLKLAKDAGLVERVRPLIQQLRQQANMWLTDAIVEAVCRQAGE